MAKVAFYTFGLLKDVEQCPEAQGFVDRIPAVFQTSDFAEGQIDRRGHPVKGPVPDVRFGPYVVPEIFDPALTSRIYQTLSFWSDLESVWAFAYGGNHGEALQHRREWFEQTEWPVYAAWWVDDGELSSITDALERATHLYQHGPTPYAFDFRTAFTPDGQPYKLDRKRALAKRLEIPDGQD